jgi:Tol biopolymer transport system component
VGIAVIVLAIAAVVFYQRKVNTAAQRPELQQITNFSESAFNPAISPDGRMLAFMVGPGGFSFSSDVGDVYVKLLPDGEPARLTRSLDTKQTLRFSPDGSRIAYTDLAARFTWNTMEVPVLGGEPRLMLPNATGLSWVDDKQLLYSTIDNGEHMGIVTSNESRSDERRIYFPVGGTGMAHRSSLSPDKKWILVVEMDGAGWLPCRLVPFDGSSTGRPVGPLNGQCTSTAWSPDGAWMYFSSNQGGGFHLWRQAFSGGAPEQLTSGATEEEGIAMASDGKSLYTSAGTSTSSIWLHDKEGDRRITEQGYAYLPAFSPDQSKLFYLVRSGKSRSYVQGQLWVTDLASQKSEKLFPDFIISHFAISNDGARIVFATAVEEGAGIWIADLSRRSAPKQLTKGGEYRVFFGRAGELIYQGRTDDWHLFRMAEDGTNPRQVSPDKIFNLNTVSPDGKWAVVATKGGNGQNNEIKVYPLTDDGPASTICDVCVTGFGPGRTGAPLISWSRDGSTIMVSLQYLGLRSKNTLALHTRAGDRPPNLTHGRIRTDEEMAKIPGAALIREGNVFPGANGSTYASSRKSAQTNIYRVTLP